MGKFYLEKSEKNKYLLRKKMGKTFSLEYIMWKKTTKINKTGKNYIMIYDRKIWFFLCF